MQTPFEVTVDLKLVVHAEDASEARVKVQRVVASANFPGASAIFAIVNVKSLAAGEDVKIEIVPHPEIMKRALEDLKRQLQEEQEKPPRVITEDEKRQMAKQ